MQSYLSSAIDILSAVAEDICGIRLGIAPITAKTARSEPMVIEPASLADPFGVRSVAMSVARIVEISSTSDKGFEDAIVQGIARASKTLREIKGAWVKEQEVIVQKDKIVEYKVILKVTFVLEAA